MTAQDERAGSASPGRDQQPGSWTMPGAAPGGPRPNRPPYPAASRPPHGAHQPAHGYPAHGYPAYPPARPPLTPAARMAVPGPAPAHRQPLLRQRPQYREPHPVRMQAVTIGACAALWYLLCGLMASGARSYAWWTIAGGLTAWLVAIGLTRAGDRGVAVGVAAVSGVAAAIVGILVTIRWIGGTWILW